MKYLSLVGIITVLACLSQVESMCHYVLKSYYDCKNLFGNSSVIQEWYFIENKLPDSFYNKTLGSIKTFQAAMDHFRTLFAEIHNCKQSWCHCVRFNLHYDTIPKYAYYFGNKTFYPQMVSILNTIKTNYKLMSPAQIKNNTLMYSFDDFWPDYKFVNDFCSKYDFSWEFFLFYKETFSCKRNTKLSELNCRENYLTLNFYNYTPVSGFPISQVEDYTSCLLTNISTCNVNIKRAIGLTYLYEYPNILQSNNVNLTTYIDRLAAANRPIRFRRFFSGINNGYGVSSTANSMYQYCAFDKGVNYSLFNSPNLKIDGKISLE